MDKLILYFRYVSISLKTRMEYRVSFTMCLFVHMAAIILNYLGIWVIFDKFNLFNGWSYYEFVFFYSINILSYGISSLFIWSSMKRLGYMVQQGTFDSILIRPINPLFHMVARNFNDAFIGYVIVTSVLIGVCINKLGINFSLFSMVMLILFIIGAVLIQSAMLVIGGSLSFWFINSSHLIDTFIYGVRRFIDYPISAYDMFIQVLLTFIIPYAFVNFYPSVYFLSKSDDALFHPALQYGTPLVGVLMFSLAYIVWSKGIKHYESTGS